MREANPGQGSRGRKFSPAGERWRPLAQLLVARLGPGGDSEEAMIQAAVGVILGVERDLGPRGPEFIAAVVPLVMRTLRRQLRERAALPSAPPAAAMPAAIAAAENELVGTLQRSPSVAEVADRLGATEDHIVAGLEAGWAAGSSMKGTR